MFVQDHVSAVKLYPESMQWWCMLSTISGLLIKNNGF